MVMSGRVRNPNCSLCGDTRGGPYGHESNECTWNRLFDNAPVSAKNKAGRIEQFNSVAEALEYWVRIDRTVEIIFWPDKDNVRATQRLVRQGDSWFYNRKKE